MFESILVVSLAFHDFKYEEKMVSLCRRGRYLMANTPSSLLGRLPDLCRRFLSRPSLPETDSICQVATLPATPCSKWSATSITLLVKAERMSWSETQSTDHQVAMTRAAYTRFKISECIPVEVFLQKEVVVNPAFLYQVVEVR
ncbi:hypothetical protein CDAR_535461 [Caerostris darwini]|uniref:Uncharacterized protein n=1 Tax=Caerostris darwini TaxID=1538125 RepID=A0AAV4V2L9_9ARAC|nr:hypothetical protein CDAR_535461 [Caerostris darwini]